jgi:hypothetical protein
MVKTKNEVIDYVENIRQSGLSIYDGIDIEDQNLWIPSTKLENILNESLIGSSLAGLPLRTRSKRVKELICAALGYPIPPTFKKSQPRFPGQDFDTYTQKSNNLQIWNEEISPNRRYVMVRVDETLEIVRVRVVDGIELSKLDTTGTLTQKYQASLVVGGKVAELIAEQDTDHLAQFVAPKGHLPDLNDVSPIQAPIAGKILPIGIVFERLLGLIGSQFDDAGSDQERNRGESLHRLISETLGFADHKDDGRFPDIRNQLIEAKLQTSPTIDLGLVRPNSEDPLISTQVSGNAIRHCDVRYALFYAQTKNGTVTLTHVFLTTGEMFFKRFPQFQGLVLNRKLQIPLPKTFFTVEAEDLPD